MKRVLLWVFRLFGVGFFWADQNLIEYTKIIVEQVEALPGVKSGEYRFSVALGKVVKNRSVSKRKAAMVIEYLIRRGVI